MQNGRSKKMIVVLKVDERIKMCGSFKSERSCEEFKMHEDHKNETKSKVRKLNCII